MSTKKIELKVTINCHKCKAAVLKSVATLEGVDEIKLDAEKGILTVVGSVDPVCVATQVRKAGNFAEIASVGPPKKPDPPKQKPDPPKPKPNEPEKQPYAPLPPWCKQCQLVGVSYDTHDGAVCSIL